MCVVVLLFVFGIAALVKGEFRITAARMVRGSIGRFLGLLMLIGAVLPFLTQDGAGIALGILVFAIIVGLVTSERTDESLRARKP